MSLEPSSLGPQSTVQRPPRIVDRRQRPAAEFAGPQPANLARRAELSSLERRATAAPLQSVSWTAWQCRRPRFRNSSTRLGADCRGVAPSAGPAIRSWRLKGRPRHCNRGRRRCAWRADGKSGRMGSGCCAAAMAPICTGRRRRARCGATARRPGTHCVGRSSGAGGDLQYSTNADWRIGPGARDQRQSA
jgi:hypothetical protein